MRTRRAMTGRRICGAIVIAAGLSWGAALLAQEAAGGSSAQNADAAPNVQNAQFATRAVSGALTDTFRALQAQAEKPEWIGYGVPEIAGDRTMCCGNYNDGNGCGTCRLEREDGNSYSRSNGSTNGTVRLEGSKELVVLFRMEGKQVTKIRQASEDCTLDAGGLAFLWLTGVKPAESVALLSGFVHDATDRDEERHLGNGALAAIAMHADASADRAFESFVSTGQPEQLRKHASFWLGAARGKSGLTLLQKMTKGDPSPEVRSQVTFALSVSREPEALNEMIRMAREDESSRVRGQALFWLAQKAGQKAVSTITGAIENDPDTDVKKKAVFALSQLPKDEGVPKLIEVAKNNRNPAVRKQAMFWLGQSHDPRALEFFEQILTR